MVGHACGTSRHCCRLIIAMRWLAALLEALWRCRCCGASLMHAIFWQSLQQRDHRVFVAASFEGVLPQHVGMRLCHCTHAYHPSSTCVQASLQVPLLQTWHHNIKSLFGCWRCGRCGHLLCREGSSRLKDGVGVSGLEGDGM